MDPHGSSKRNVSSDTTCTVSVICLTLYRDSGSPEVRVEVLKAIVIHGTPISLSETRMLLEWNGAVL
jgi:hypothetical protein